MSRAMRWRFNLAVGATFIIVSTVAEIRNRLPLSYWLHGWSGWAAMFIVTAVALRIIPSLWHFAIGLRFVRKFVLGKRWIEGTWFFHTAEYGNGPAKVTQVGLATFEYEGPELTLTGRVSSVLCADGEEIETNTLTMVLDEKLHYLHHFVRAVENVQSAGVAFGSFSCVGGRAPNRYRGGVVFLGGQDRHTRTQRGVKLAEDDVRKLSKQFGNEWEQRLLHDRAWLEKLVTRYPRPEVAEALPAALQA
jgi:hypothetical protein